jgi:hypothetical protein
MRIPYKAAQLVLYGNGEDVYLATSEKMNRIVVFDSRAVMTLTWNDPESCGDQFSISLNRKEFIECIRKRKPRSGFYILNITDHSNISFYDNNGFLCKDKASCFICDMQYTVADITRFNQLYSGLCVDQSIITGSIVIDFDRLRSVNDFINQYISSGRFGMLEIRVVNLQVVNENYPLIIQAYIKCEENILCDLDVAFLPFNR